MKVKFKKNLGKYLQGETYDITQEEFDTFKTHLIIIDKAEEKPLEVKNKILTKKDVNKK